MARFKSLVLISLCIYNDGWDGLKERNAQIVAGLRLTENYENLCVGLEEAWADINQLIDDGSVTVEWEGRQVEVCATTLPFLRLSDLRILFWF